jgi:hypothetical protein
MIISKTVAIADVTSRSWPGRGAFYVDHGREAAVCLTADRIGLSTSMR